MIIIILNVDVFTCLCCDTWMHYRESISFIFVDEKVCLSSSIIQFVLFSLFLIIYLQFVKDESVYLFLFFEFARMEHIFSHVYGFDCVRCPTRIGIEHDWRHLFRYQRRPLRYVSILSLAAYFGLELQQFEYMFYLQVGRLFWDSTWNIYAGCHGILGI
jgi:hypothetical protein